MDNHLQKKKFQFLIISSIVKNSALSHYKRAKKLDPSRPINNPSETPWKLLEMWVQIFLKGFSW